MFGFWAIKNLEVLLITVLLFLTIFVRAGYAAEYLLGPGDELSIDVVEQSELSADRKIIQADGSISISRLGRIVASDINVSDLTDLVRQKLTAVLGISNPSVVIEVVRYRPIYIAGDVANPGSYEYVPGITALQAISVAGGSYRPTADNLGSFLELARVRERLAQYREQIAISLMRRARFIAETDNLEIVVPEAVSQYIDPERIEILAKRESDLIERRRKAYVGELSILTDLGEELDKEIVALQAQRNARERQLELIGQEADVLRSLKDRRLVTQSRSLGIDREKIGIEADVLEVIALIARSQTSRRRIEQDKLNLTTRRSLEVLNGIKEEEDTIAQLEELIAAGQRQIRTTDGLPLDVETQLGGSDSARVLNVVREERDKTRTFSIGLNEKLLPGDVLYVSKSAEVSIDGLGLR